MIGRLKRKFVMILMGVVSVILLAVFLAIFLSTWSNARNASENTLRQALQMTQPSYAFGLPGRGERMPILVAEIGYDGTIYVFYNQLYFIDEAEVISVVQSALESDRSGGVLSDKALRFLKSDDGRRIAITDASAEQETLRELLTNSLLIGSGALVLFFFLSLALSSWAVRPVALAWQRQRQFAADASHELKTPLTVILSNADMLRDQAPASDEKRARRLEHIHAEAQRMKKLVEDLLALAKADSVEEKQVYSQVDFSDIVTNSILTFEPIVFDEEKKLKYEIKNNLLINGDASRLQQLLGVLLDNARKYCLAGGEIKISVCETDKKSLLLSVFNEGEPIPQEELKQVFLRFYRLDKSRSAPDSYGLGLSIAEGIVKEHGGKIWVESHKNGNSFYVTFPAVKN